jgi:hypothetical protein
VKNALFVVALLIVLCLVVSAQEAKVPVTHLGGNGDPSFQGTAAWGNPPTSAAQLIFYGGDLNQNDPNQYAFANGNTILMPDTTTYGAVTSPKGDKVVATGILFNQVPTILSGTVFDPATATYDIRANVSEGNGGIEVVSGSGPQTATLTGRTLFNYYPEYATSVNFSKPLTPTFGVTYWVNMSSQCTDSSNTNCSALQLFADNTTEQTNGINASLQPSGQVFFNSAFFGFNWANWCDASFDTNTHQCQYLSFGIYGN